MRAITPCLWFEDKAEEAADFYVAIFSALRGNSKIKNVARYGEAGARVSGKPEGSAMTVTFELDGQEFLALNGGPLFTFSPAISFIVNCKSQQEVDDLWEKLSAGGKPGQCGWLQDKYGVSWQIVPTVLGELLQDKDARKAERAMQAMLQMKKIDIAALVRASQT